MNSLETLVRLHDLDLLRRMLDDRAAAARLADLGVPAAPADGFERARARLASVLDRRWLTIYERALARYGRGLAAVRERVCQGCFITLPTSALPGPDSPMMCESCGRVLCWR